MEIARAVLVSSYGVRKHCNVLKTQDVEHDVKQFQ